MLQSLGRKSAIWSERIIPDAFVFAVILSAVIFLLGIVVADKTPVEMVGYWYDGFWNFLGFSMQMVLILLTGYVLAQSPPIRAVIQRLAGQPKTSRQAILLIAVVTIFAGFINWGLGLVIGAILAIAVSLSAKQRGIRVHFPLAVAAGYLALSIHSAGFSSTAPLIVNTDNHFLFQQIGRIPFTETVLTSWNFLAVLAYIIVVPLLLVFLSPPEDEVREVGDFHESKPTEEGLDGEPAATLVKKLENSRLITALVVLPGLYYISSYFYDRGFDLNINIVNFTFLIIGLALYQRPLLYIKAITAASSSAAGIVVQFPFYAGILGMMSLSGLIEVFSGGMVAVSTQYTFPILAFFSAALVNFFVPSAGGQWAVQGPILLQAGEALNVPVGVTIMAHQYGDQLTNMLQPFWALPLLGLTGLKARDILGYTALTMIPALVIFGLPLLILPYIW